MAINPYREVFTLESRFKPLFRGFDQGAALTAGFVPAVDIYEDAEKVILKLEVPCDVAPGRVEVVLTVQSHQSGRSQGRIDWGQLSGLGREIWQGIDARSYLSDLRADRELGT